jgi:invasion protein IalB
VIRDSRPTVGVFKGRLARETTSMSIRDLGWMPRTVAQALASALAGVAIVLGAMTAGGSQAAAQGVVRSVSGDWQIRCETPPGAQGEQCALMQSVTAEDRPNVGLTVLVLKIADLKSRLMRVVRAGFVKCLPNGCLAEINMDDKLISQLRNGQTATFIIFQSPEEGIGFPMSLKGFGEGFDKLP